MAGLFGNFVVPDALAAPADLAAWTGAEAPANAVPLLRSATTLVLAATKGAYYAVDPATGLATDTAVAKVLKDVTCIQAAAWASLGVDPLTGGVVVEGVESQVGIGSGRVSYADAAHAAAAKTSALTDLVPEAQMKLSQNNLLSSNVWVYG